jgi:integrase
MSASGPPLLLDLLREWWKAARPQGWLFPGRYPVQPMTTRQLNRACHAAAQLAEIDKRVSLHTLRHSFATHPAPAFRRAPITGAQNRKSALTENAP